MCRRSCVIVRIARPAPGKGFSVRSDGGRLGPLLDEAPKLLPSPQAALGVDVAQVVLDGLGADIQFGGGLPVGEAASDEAGDYLLLSGQAVRVGRDWWVPASPAARTTSPVRRRPRQWVNCLYSTG
jgi:hypothetical protein